MICAKCVYKEFLIKFISENGAAATCDYCGSNTKCVPDDQLIAYLVERVRSVLVPTDELSQWDQITVFRAGSDQIPVFPLGEVFEWCDPIGVDAFVEVVCESMPDEQDKDGNTVLYALNDGDLDDHNDYEWKWAHFVRSIKHDLRFLNKGAESFCDELFNAAVLKGGLKEELVFVVAPVESICRARIAYSKSDIETIAGDPASQIGPVPPFLASSQRMTPAGVSSFYASLDRKTCISELRPLVGDVIISGEFQSKSGLRLFDLDALTAIARPTDIFSDQYVNEAHASAFYKELVFQLTRPSSRGDQNSYLATQYIFEYLRVRFGAEVQGLIYSSVQTNGDSRCIALFPEKSTVSIPDSKRGRSPAEGDGGILKFIEGSLRYHRIKSASYEGSESDSLLDVTMDDRIMRLMFPSERY